MQTIQPIQLENAGSSTRRLLENIDAERGTVSNMLKAMAHSPSTLEGYLQFGRSLKAGELGGRLREQIALAVAQANGGEYCAAQHALLARRVGLTDDEILASFEGRSSNPKVQAALRFASELAMDNAQCSVTELRLAGYKDSEIVEIVGNVALNTFENYFNRVTRTEVDFPRVGLSMHAA